MAIDNRQALIQINDDLFLLEISIKEVTILSKILLHSIKRYETISSCRPHREFLFLYIENKDDSKSGQKSEQEIFEENTAHLNNGRILIFRNFGLIG
jgi:hypothetical protein